MITWPSTKARRRAGSVARPSTAPITDAGAAMYNAAMRCVGRRFILAAAILLSVAATVAGAEWSEIGSTLPRTIAAVTTLAIDPATPSTLYAIDRSGRLFKSIDSGGSWNARGNVVGVSFVVVDPKDSFTIYAATWRGLFKSTDGGENWAGADSGLAGLFYDSSTITIDPLTPATLYATTSEGVFKSTDAARSWNKLDTVQAGDNFGGGIAIDPVTPSTIYFGFIYIDFINGDEQGILKSTNGGQSWTRLGPPNAHRVSNPYRLVIDPINTSTLYAPSSKSDGNILKTTDGGQTWTVHPAAPLARRFCLWRLIRQIHLLFMRAIRDLRSPVSGNS
jgi:hypothetical protein